MFSRDGEVGDDALGAPVLGGEGDPVADRVPRRRDPDGLAVDLDLAGVGAVGAVEQPDQLGPSGTEEPGDPDDLAVVDVDVGRLEDAAPADPGRSQHGRRGAVDVALGDLRDGLELDESRPDHLRHEVAAGEVLRAVLADELAVAEHRDPVRDLVDLLEEVADEQDGDALVAQVADHREQPLDLVRGRGSRSARRGPAPGRRAPWPG